MPLPTLRAPDVAGPGPAPADPACVSCGHPVDARFCPACGERRASDRRYTLAALAGEALESLTNADSRVWRTLRMLALRPGELTRAYMRGSRNPYLGPVQLFLLTNVVYFVYAAWVGERVFDTPLSNHYNNSNYGDWARRLVEERVASRGVTEAEYASAFNAAASVQARTLIGVMVPMFAALLALLEIDKRRAAVEHLTFSLHLYTALLILAILQRFVVQWPTMLWVRMTGQGVDWDTLITTFMLASVGLYIALALRRVYGDRWPSAAARTAVLCTGVLMILALYRALLFSITFWST